MLATIDSAEGLPTLRQLFAAHHYWRRRGMTVDLVVLNTQPSSSYLQELNERIMEAMFASSDAGMDQPGGVFVRRSDQLDADALLMLRATARLLPALRRALAGPRPGRGRARRGGAGRRGRGRVPAARAGAALAARIAGADGASARTRPTARRARRPRRRPRRTRGPRGRAARPPAAASGAAPLLFDNGFGGLAADGDYQMRVRGDRVPPAPWVNVVANPHGGFVVTERGAGFTWAENSYFYRLTPWHNDPVSDPASEALYLRDEETGELWSATPAPVRGDAEYTVRHGAGSSTFEHEHDGIATRLTLAMADGEPVKLSVLRVDQPRRAPAPASR